VRQIDVKLLEIKSKFQFFKLTSEEKVLVCQKVRYEYHLFLRLNFSHATILNFCDVMQLPLLLRGNFLLYATQVKIGGSPLANLKNRNLGFISKM